MFEQTIPIIITEKTLKKIFLEIINEINSFFKYKFQLIEADPKKEYNYPIIVLDDESLNVISSSHLKRSKYFTIKTINSNKSNIDETKGLIQTPFKILDLISMVENSFDQLKRRSKKKVNFDHHSFDYLSRRLHKGNRSIRLTEKESEIFSCLLENDNQYLTKKFLLEKVWSYSQEIDTHTLETHLYSLRKKIDQNLGTKNLIKHIEKKGYLIDRTLL